MTQYNVLLSDEAWEDLDKLMIVIAEEYKSPITAQRYIAEIWNEIIRLRNYAGAKRPTCIVNCSFVTDIRSGALIIRK